MWLLNLKIHFHPKRKNPHGRMLKRKSKEQYLSTVPKSCSLSLSLSIYIYIYIYTHIYKMFISRRMFITWLLLAILFQVYIASWFFRLLFLCYLWTLEGLARFWHWWNKDHFQTQKRQVYIFYSLYIYIYIYHIRFPVYIFDK